MQGAPAAVDEDGIAVVAEERRAAMAAPPPAIRDLARLGGRSSLRLPP